MAARIADRPQIDRCGHSDGLKRLTEQSDELHALLLAHSEHRRPTPHRPISVGWAESGERAGVAELAGAVALTAQSPQEGAAPMLEDGEPVIGHVGNDNLLAHNLEDAACVGGGAREAARIGAARAEQRAPGIGHHVHSASHLPWPPAVATRSRHPQSPPAAAARSRRPRPPPAVAARNSHPQ